MDGDKREAKFILKKLFCKMYLFYHYNIFIYLSFRIFNNDVKACNSTESKSDDCAIKIKET